MQNNSYNERIAPEANTFRERVWSQSSSSFVLVVRMFLMGMAVFAVGWGLTIISASLWGALAAILGVWIGEKVGRTHLRLWVIVVLSFLGLLFFLGVAHFFGSSTWFVESFGALLSAELAESLRWIAVAGFGVIALRSASVRYSSVVLLEILLPLLAAVSLLSSHRNGNLHRPQWLADWVLGNGEDPIWYLMLMGLAGAIFLAIGLLKIRRISQFFGGIIILLLLMGLFFWISSDPSAIRSLKGVRGSSQGTGSKNEQHLPFRPPPQSSSGRQRPIAVVIFEDDYKPRSKVYYFRQRTFSRYNGIRMQLAIRDDADRSTSSHFPAAGVLMKLPKTQGNRRLVRTRVSLLRAHVSPFGLVAAESFKGLPNPNTRIFLRSYRVKSKIFEQKMKLQHSVINPNWSKNLRSFLLRAPTDKRYQTLLKEILTPLKHSKYKNLPLAKAFMIKFWLEQNGAYSLSVRAPRGVRDHVAHFLFGSRIGYCVHFSHAAVYLMRLAGIPARIAEGYAVPSRYRGNSSSLLIREAEAHAWPEIYVHGVGWIVFDIYPKRTLDRQIPPPDPKLRQMMANLARKQQNAAMKKEQQQSGKKTKKTATKKFSLKIYAKFLFLFILLFLYGMKFWRRWIYFLATPPKRVFLFYRSLEDRFSERGIRRELGETLGYFALRLHDFTPTLQSLINRMVSVRLGSRLTPSHFQPNDESSLLKEMASKTRWYWTFLYLIDPISWSFHIFHRWLYYPPFWLRLLNKIFQFPKVVILRYFGSSKQSLEGEKNAR